MNGCARIWPQHGGDIEIEKLEDGVLHVRMHGQCSGCPSAELTLENLVNTELKEAFPELKDVVLVTGVSDDLIAQARQIMRQRKKQKIENFLQADCMRKR